MSSQQASQSVQRIASVVLLGSVLGILSGCVSNPFNPQKRTQTAVTSDTEMVADPSPQQQTAKTQSTNQAGRTQIGLQDASSLTRQTSNLHPEVKAVLARNERSNNEEAKSLVVLASPIRAESSDSVNLLVAPVSNDEPPLNQKHNPISLDIVVDSIHDSFPLLEAAYQQIQIANGNQLAAQGAFDTKISASSESNPLGFYETYRHKAGIYQPLTNGGELFGGYRIGRGSYEPWYLERQTNDGGEIAAGLTLPLMRNREIDARRAERWRAEYDQQIALPEIQAQLLLYVRDGSIIYWQWIKAGQKQAIGKRALDLALSRNEQIRRKVEVGDLAPPALDDNQRAIAKRRSKLITLEQELSQYAIKLSMYLRTSQGEIVTPDESQVADFPSPVEVNDIDFKRDIESAISTRPELRTLELKNQKLRIDLAQARNDFLPSLDAQLIGSQDLGEPTSAKRDKSELELQARVIFEMPVQRRKATGKTQAISAKIAQNDAKIRFMRERVRIELRVAHAALKGALARLDQARESKRLAESLALTEGRKLELGETDLLTVALRETMAIEAAESEVDAFFDFYSAKADYEAAMARRHPR